MSHHRLSSFVGLVASVLASVACKPQPAVAPPQPSASAGRCARNGGTTNNLPMNNLPMNNLPMNNLPMNGLSQQSLALNKPLLLALAKAPLRPDLFVAGHVEPTFLAANEFSPQLMKYIAACALDPCDWIDAPDALANDPTVTLADYSIISGVEKDRKRRGFVGELGLCGARSGALSWADAPPSPDCLERVSACMLARTNALEAKVMISLRGTGMDLADQVPVNTLYREHSGTPIVSFAPRAACDPDQLSNQHGNCGWQPLLVGQCVHDLTTTPKTAPPRQVSLAVTEPREPVELRVCGGIYGCDDNKGQPITIVNGSATRPDYAGDLLGAGLSKLSFPCPDNGPPDEAGHATGYFAVMARSRDGRVLPSTTVSARYESPTIPHDSYPAPEADVFTYREGSFFGNLFTKLPPKEETRQTMLGGDQYACFSSIWTEGIAMFESRICANVTAKLPNGCFANIPGPCDASQAPSTEHCPVGLPCVQRARMIAGMCTPTKDPAPIASHCDTSVNPLIARGGHPWKFPYTTYLNHPCDLLGTRCREAYATFVGTSPP